MNIENEKKRQKKNKTRKGSEFLSLKLNVKIFTIFLSFYSAFFLYSKPLFSQTLGLPLSEFYLHLSEDLVCDKETKNICEKFEFYKKEIAEHHNGLIDREKLQILARESREKIDFSLFNPQESKIWKNKKRDEVEKPLLSNDETVRYLSFVPIYIGLSGFLVETKAKKRYLIVFGRNAHNILLRKALLKRLGYKTPPYQHVKKMKVKFNSSNRWKLFTKNVQRKMKAINIDRWITNIDRRDMEKNNNKNDPLKSNWKLKEQSPENLLIFQDVLVTSEKNDFYDLAQGPPISKNRPLVKDRRVFRSLLIPYSLVDIPETLNKWQWNMGQEFNNKILFPSKFEEFFQTSYSDGKWIARKILKLKREDFEKIAKEGVFPRSVELLAVEKLISRRNSLCSIFFPQDKNCIKDVNIKVTDPEDPELLKEGILLKNTREGKYDDENSWWIGYGSRFSYGADESPLSQKEIFSFVKSQFFSNILSNFITEVNTDILPNSQDNLQEEARKQYIEDFTKQFNDDLNALERGERTKPPRDRLKSFKTWTKEMFGFRLNAGRDVIFGNYQGTDNQIQLVHSFGWAMDLGLFLGSHGGPRDLGVFGNLGLSYGENYIHITPTKSVEAANKMPYRNIFVNFTMEKISRGFENFRQENPELIHLDFFDLKKKSREEQKDLKEKGKKFIEKMSKTLEKNLKVGESFLMIRNIGPFSALNALLSLGHEMTLSTQIRKQIQELDRIHIFRKSQKEVQVYISNGHSSGWGFTVQFKKFIPIFTYRYNYVKSAKPFETNFFKLNMELNQEENPQITENLIVLEKLFSSPFYDEDNLFELSRLQSPVKISHNFEESTQSIDFLWMNHVKLQQFDKIKVEEKAGEENFEKDYFIVSSGKRSGDNYQKLSLNIANYIIQDLRDGKDDIILNFNNTSRPSETIFGKSTSREITLEGVLKPKAIEEPFLKLTYTWKGWSSSKQKAEKIFKEINDFQSSLRRKTNLEALPIERFNMTKELQLYSIYYNIYIYEEGLKSLSTFGNNNETFITNFFIEKKIFNNFGCPNTIKIETAPHLLQKGCGRPIVRRFFEAQEAYKRAFQNARAQDLSKATIALMSFTEGLSFSDFSEMIGGVKNFYASSYVIGFREGDEGNFEPIRGNTLGEVKSRKPQGPLMHTLRRLDVSHSEFYLYWMMRQL